MTEISMPPVALVAPTEGTCVTCGHDHEVHAYWAHEVIAEDAEGNPTESYRGKVTHCDDCPCADFRDIAGLTLVMLHLKMYQPLVWADIVAQAKPAN